MDRGLAWLLSQRNVVDGSWGSSDALKYTHTSEAVLALAALNQQDAAYYAGLSWLSNHLPANFDASSRKVLALGAAGGVVDGEVLKMQEAQGQQFRSGWGLSEVYAASPLDTALALQALAGRGLSSEGITRAIEYLDSTRLLGDGGWPIEPTYRSTSGPDPVVDPFTTAQAMIALQPFISESSQANMAVFLAVRVLNDGANANWSIPEIAISIVASLRYDPSGTSFAQSNLPVLLSALVVQQSTNGSWNNDAYATALALRALAAAAGKDLASEGAVVDIPDANLRAAINSALGRPALDAITVGQMRQLTSLSLSGKGITDLTGLEKATNLTYLDISNNSIASFGPISGLSLSIVVHTGDINADGVVDIVDLYLLQQMILDRSTLTSAQAVRADMFPLAAGDGVVDVSDLWILQNKILTKTGV